MKETLVKIALEEEYLKFGKVIGHVSKIKMVYRILPNQISRDLKRNIHFFPMGLEKQHIILKPRPFKFLLWHRCTSVQW